MLVQHGPDSNYTLPQSTYSETSVTETNNNPLTSSTLLINTTTNSITMQPNYQQISEMGVTEDDTSLHKTAVLVIMSILICISLTISAGVLIFCKKKNSVFAYQKSEQTSTDYGYEMDDINTDNESTDSLDNTEPIRSKTYPSITDINSSSNRIKYKFIPKSKTFSGLDSCGLDNMNNSSTFGSESYYSSSSPSLNFQSLTIKVDIEPCQKSQSSDCLTDHSTYNDYSSTSVIQSCNLMHSNSAERLKSSIPWDFESTPWESFDEKTKLKEGDTHYYDLPREALTNRNSDFMYNFSTTPNFFPSSDKKSLTNDMEQNSDSSDDAICQPLLQSKVV